jgi:hypothetical protein
MYKYQAIFSRETHPKEKIQGRCAFVISLSFQQPELPQTSAQENTHDLHKFSAVLRRLNFAFEEIDIVLSDTLNKHNASIYYPDNDPEEKSRALGDAWLESAYFRQAVSSLTQKPLIKRWNELVSDKNFNDAKTIIKDLYKNNKKFRWIVESVCADFVAFLCRKRKNIFEDQNTNKSTSVDYSNFNIDEAYKNCLTYILEECAVTLLFRLNGYVNLFHIGKVNAAVDWVAKNPISLDANHSNLIKPINDNPLEVFTVSKFKPCQYSVASTSDKTKPKEKSNLSYETIFKKNIIFRRKTIPDITKENQPPILKHRISRC